MICPHVHCTGGKSCGVGLIDADIVVAYIFYVKHYIEVVLKNETSWVRS